MYNPTTQQILDVQGVMTYITEEFEKIPGPGNDVTSQKVFNERKESFDRMINKIDEVMRANPDTIPLLLHLKHRIQSSIQMMELCFSFYGVKEENPDEQA